jgi:hypothetical protein
VTEELLPTTSGGAMGVMEEDAATRERIRKRPPLSKDCRRFVTTVTIGLLAALIPYLWELWGLWNGFPHPFRSTRPAGFYDLQARAMLNGHLWVPKGSLGIEGFVHNGHTYTYFGIFPSLIRMPIFLVTHYFDGHLTAPSMLLGWLVAAVFSALLVWRIRILMRGRAELGRMEAASYGLLLAAMMGGSVFVYLASDTWVYHEDLVWSVALIVGSMFTLLGVLEKPTWRRVVASGVLVLAASLNRLPTGYACIVAALLVAGWLALGRDRTQNRRWALPMALVGLVPLVALTVVSLLKFGVPFSVPLNEQVFTHINAHRRAALAASGGDDYGLQFLPSTLLAYFQPGGIRLTGVFPFITLPAEPARAVGTVILDRANRTASLTASMPLLFLLTCWGVVASFRRRPLGRGNLTRIVVIAGVISCGPVMLFAYISDRYLADLLPLFIVASAVGLIDLWGRTTSWRRGMRRVMVIVLTLLTVISFTINLAVASTPQPNTSHTQALAYVRRQVSVANLLGVPLTGNIRRGKLIPHYAPADTLFVAGNCSAIYLSNGERFATLPPQQLRQKTWIPLKFPQSFRNDFALTIHASPAYLTKPVRLMTIGRDAVLVVPDGIHHIRAELIGPHLHLGGRAVKVRRGKTYSLDILTDPYLRVLRVGNSLTAVLPSGPRSVLPPPHATAPPAAITFVVKHQKTKQESGTRSFCRSVLRAGRS